MAGLRSASFGRRLAVFDYKIRSFCGKIQPREFMAEISLSKLRAIPRYSQLSEVALEWIVAHSEKVKVPKDTVIIREDDEPNFIFIIKTGKVKLTKTGSDGNECVVHLMGNGECFVELSQAQSPSCYLTATTLTECLILKMTRENHLELLARQPSLALWVINDLASWGRDMCSRIRDLGISDVELRLARLFFQLGDRVGPGADYLDLQISRKEIAGIICARPETVTRLIGRWKKLGIVVVAPSGLRVHRSGLRKILAAGPSGQTVEPYRELIAGF